MEKSPLEKLREMENKRNSHQPSPNKFLVKYSPTIISMGLSFLLYITFIDWKFSIGLLLLTLLHEVGHMIAAKYYSLRVNVPVFVPFLGAFVRLEDLPRNSYVQSVVSFGGPLAGGIGALLVLIAGYFCADPVMKNFLLILAWFTALINLLNLIPFMGLDGAGISSPMKTVHWVIFLFLFPVLIFWCYHETSHLNPVLLLIFIASFVRTAVGFAKDKGVIKLSLLEQLKHKGRFPDEGHVGNKLRFQAMLGYFILSIGLTALIIYSEIIRGSPPWKFG